MNDRELPNAAARWGASLMTRVYAMSEAGSSPRRLAATGATAHDRTSEAGHPENPRLSVNCFTPGDRQAPISLRCLEPSHMGNLGSDRLIERYVGMWPISHQVLAVSQLIRSSNVVIGIRRRMLMPMPEVGAGSPVWRVGTATRSGSRKLCGQVRGVLGVAYRAGRLGVVFLAVTLSGCGTVYSIFPLSDSSQSAVDTRLLGSWIQQAEEENVFITVKDAGGGQMSAEVFHKRESRYDVSIEEATFGVLCTDLEGTPYCSIRVPENVSRLVGDVPRDARYIIARYEVTGDEIVMEFLDSSAVESAISQGLVKGRAIDSDVVVEEETGVLRHFINSEAILPDQNSEAILPHQNCQLRLQRVQELEVATTLQAWKDQRRQPRRDIPFVKAEGAPRGPKELRVLAPQGEHSSAVTSTGWRRKIAIVIGISDYRNLKAPEPGDPPGTLHDLAYAEEDARAFAELFDRKELVGVDWKIFKFLGTDAERSSIMETLQELLTTLGERDLIMLFFAGHARASLLDPTDVYLMTYADAEILAYDGVPYKWLRDLI